jgi:HSP20 family protein
MSMLTRWNPFRQSMRFDPLTDVDDLFRNLNLRPLLREFDTMPPEIRMDVREDDTSYRVIVDMPGVNKDDIEVSVEDNQVTIQGETKRQEERKTDKEIHSERYIGKCFRSFALPREVDSEKCAASYDNGVLTLTLPKRATDSLNACRSSDPRASESRIETGYSDTGLVPANSPCIHDRSRRHVQSTGSVYDLADRKRLPCARPNHRRRIGAGFKHRTAAQAANRSRC